MTKPALSAELADMLLELNDKRKENPWHPKNPATRELRRVMKIAFQKGWGQGRMAETLRISRQAVYEHISKAPETAETDSLWSAIPYPPITSYNTVVADRTTDPSALIIMEPDEVQYMYNLSRQARTVTGGTPDTDPARLASENYTALLVKYLDDGYTVTGLAAEIGVTASSIHNRLRRHGMRGPLPEGQKPYRHTGEEE